MSITTVEYAIKMAKGELNYPIHTDLAHEIFGLPDEEVEAFDVFVNEIKDSQPTTNVFITAAQADGIINPPKDRNKANRTVAAGSSRKYQRDMEDGEWAPFSSTIVFDADGMLRDGQHRLNAVAKSGKGQWFKVQTYATDDTVEGVDMGRKRKVTDLLAIRGFDKQYTEHTKIAIDAIHAVNEGAFGKNQRVIQSFTSALTLAFAENYSDELIRVVSGLATLQRNTPVNVRALMALPFLVDEKHREKAIAFGLKVAGMKFDTDEDGDPLRRLHFRCDKIRGNRRNGAGFGSIAEKEEMLGVIFAAWNAWIDDEELPLGYPATHKAARSKKAQAACGAEFNQDVFRPKHYTNLNLTKGLTEEESKDEDEILGCIGTENTTVAADGDTNEEDSSN